MDNFVDVRTDVGRTHKISQQLIGFVSRDTPLLILGQQACGVCKYKTIEEQDKDRHDEEERERQEKEERARAKRAAATVDVKRGAAGDGQRVEEERLQQ